MGPLTLRVHVLDFVNACKLFFPRKRINTLIRGISENLGTVWVGSTVR